MKLQESMTPSAAATQEEDRWAKLPDILQKIDEDEEFYYLDEAVFT